MGSQKDMGRKAVDAVLLPDEAMVESAIEANRKLVGRSGRQIVLDKEKCLPHISLAMGSIDERDVGAIGEILEVIAGKNRLGELKVCGIMVSTNARGEKVLAFEVEKTRELVRLHEALMKRLMPYFSRDVTEEMIYGEEEVAETTLDWIENYAGKAAFENFMPHITIGYGDAEGEMLPITFRASRLALCHLGNHCTCRRVLAAVNL